MSDTLIERRNSNDRRIGEDRRKGPRRMSDVYPPPNTEDWKKILYQNIDHFANKYMISLQELKMLIDELIIIKEKDENQKD